jgi:predicted permease
MKRLVWWLLAKRHGRAESDRFLEELDELHQVKVRAEGVAAGDRWYRREVRRALLSGVSGLLRRSPHAGSGRVRLVAPAHSVIEAVFDLIRDFRFGVRTLRRRPLFALLVIGTLGLGIGASSTVFSLVDGVLLTDMAYEQPGELATIWQTYPEWADHELLSEAWDKVGLSWKEFLTLREETQAFSAVGVHRSRAMTLAGVGTPVRLDVGETSAGLFPLLAVRPLLGRTFLPDEEGPGAPRLVILSHELWRTRFGSDPDMVGRPVSLDGEPWEVIGVLPPEVRIHSTLFNLFRSALDTGDRALWVPVAWDGRTSDGNHDLEAIGRLRPGASRDQALDEVDHILRNDRTHAELGFRLTTPKDEVVGGYRSPLLLLLGASGLLLLIACGNAATLLLGEAVDRRGEISTRVAMGASRFRITRQLLTESLILGLGGSLVGIALTPLGVKAFLAMGPALPRLQEVGVNQSVLLASALAGGLCAAVFGLAPVFLQHKESIHAALQREGRSRMGGTGKIQTSLISGELALTMVLLVTGGLLAESFLELSRVDPGFEARGVATVRAQVRGEHFGTDPAAQRNGARRFRHEALRRVEAIPGVLHAGAIDGLPFPGRVSGNTFFIEGPGLDGRQEVVARTHRASPGYFDAMGIPLLEGRGLLESDGEDGAEPVAVINESMARRFWPGGSPLGAGIGEGSGLRRIVGVVGDVRERHLTEEPLPMVYRHLSSRPGDFSIVARTAGAPENLVPLMREAVWAADPGIPVTQETTMQVLVAESARAERFRTFLVTGFGCMATVLALVGVFGVTARSVAHRNREMGIRRALGAQNGGLIRMMALGTLRAGGLGIGIGLLGSVGATRLLTAFFFGTRAWDGGTYAGAALLLGSLCVGAAALAARRATRVDPMQVLRE